MTRFDLSLKKEGKIEKERKRFESTDRKKDEKPESKYAELLTTELKVKRDLKKKAMAIRMEKRK